MATKVIRVDAETHRRLVELSMTTGATLADTVRAATEALWRRRFVDRVTGELESLRSDPTEWSDYLAEAEKTSVSDGLG